MRHYEGLFLFASRDNKPDYASVEQHVSEVLAKYGAKLLKTQKWAERKLAYEVKRSRRGAYLLAYFDVDPAKLPEIRRDLQISERILRNLVLACEEVPQELPEFMEFKEEPLGGEGEFRGRWGSRGGRGDDRGDRRPRRGEESAEGAPDAMGEGHRHAASTSAGGSPRAGG